LLRDPSIFLVDLMVFPVWGDGRIRDLFRMAISLRTNDNHGTVCWDGPFGIAGGGVAAAKMRLPKGPLNFDVGETERRFP
jgi:hypothetical protein